MSHLLARMNANLTASGNVELCMYVVELPTRSKKRDIWLFTTWTDSNPEFKTELKQDLENNQLT